MSIMIDYWKYSFCDYLIKLLWYSSKLNPIRDSILTQVMGDNNPYHKIKIPSNEILPLKTPQDVKNR